MQDEPTPRSTPRFEVLEIAIEAIAVLRPVVAKIRRFDRELGEPIRDALNSVALNLAEGSGCEGGHRTQRFGTASGSNLEARTGLRLAVAWRYVEGREVAAGEALLDRVAAMLHRLNPRR